MIECMSRDSRECIHKILIIRLSALGDIVNTLPLLPVLREAFPKASIDYMTAGLTVPLLEADPLVNKVICHKKSRRPDRYIPVLWKLRHAAYDLVIDFQSSRYSRSLVKATGASYRLGNGHRPVYTHPVDTRVVRDQATSLFREILKPLELGDYLIAARFPGLEAGAQSLEPVLEKVSLEKGGYVVFNPGHSPSWRTKRWPFRHWVKLGELCLNAGLKVVISGGPDERQVGTKLVGCLGDGAVSLAGETDLFQLGALMRFSRGVVSTDSGPMHVAAMCGASVVALFGPTNAVLSAPFGNHHRVLQRELDCVECFKKECPTQHECLDEMGPELVWGNLTDLLERKG